MGRAASLATIADHIGETDLRDQVIQQMIISYDYWFNTSHTPGMAYETNWGGVVNGAGWNNTWVDFGNA